MKQPPAFLNRTEIAAIMGLSASRVSQLAAEGVLPQDPQGRHPKEQTHLAIIAHFRQGAELGELKRNKLQKEGRLLDVQLRRAEGETMTVAEVERAWAHIVLTVREKLLRVANKISPRIPLLKSGPEIEQLIQGEIEECLLALSKQPEYQPSGGNSGLAENPRP